LRGILNEHLYLEGKFCALDSCSVIEIFDYFLVFIVMTSERPSIITSNHSSGLAVNDEKYMRPGGTSSNYYYKAIRIIVDRTDTYDIRSLSGIDTYGFLYNGTFYPLNPLTNLIKQDDDSGGGVQFRFSAFLVAGASYTLVVSTHGQLVTGIFSIVATGPGSVRFLATTQPTPSTYNYSSALTTDSGNFSRGENSSNHYYEAIQLIVNTAGNYTFTSKSSIDTYGYIYQYYFDPLNPFINILSRDDDSGGDRNFKLIVFLLAGGTYILVVTTFSEYVTGLFSIVGSGPDKFGFIPINNYTTY
jgi:hypothetical protein